jgi:hypothetical protein
MILKGNGTHIYRLALKVNTHRKFSSAYYMYRTHKI